MNNPSMFKLVVLKVGGYVAGNLWMITIDFGIIMAKVMVTVPSTS